MQIEKALFLYLKSQSDIFDLVQNRIYPHVIPQDAPLPAVTYQRISSEQMKSAVLGNYGLTRPIFQFSAYAKSYSEMKDIEFQIKSALINFQGDMNGVDIQGIFITSEIDGYDDETMEFYTNLDFEIYYAVDNFQPKLFIPAGSTSLITADGNTFYVR